MKSKRIIPCGRKILEFSRLAFRFHEMREIDTIFITEGQERKEKLLTIVRNRFRARVFVETTRRSGSCFRVQCARTFLRSLVIKNLCFDHRSLHAVRPLSRILTFADPVGRTLKMYEKGKRTVQRREGPSGGGRGRGGDFFVDHPSPGNGTCR